MAEFAKYSELSPQWTEFVSHYPAVSKVDRVSLVERRRILDGVAASGPARDLPEDIKEDAVAVCTFSINARDGYSIPVRSYVPRSLAAANPRPLLVYLHAGGFLFGDLESGDLNCRVLAARLHLSVLNVDYRLAPTWPFPHGVNDSYDAVEWAALNAESSLDASPAAGFLVGGISSGANFAGVVAYQARDAGLSPPLTGLFLSVPVALMPRAYGLVPPEWKEQLRSIEQNGSAPLLTERSLALIEEAYKSPPEDPRISFLLNTDHTRLPGRAYFQICGLDPLRDEALLWEKLTRSHSGTRSKVDLYSGLPHGFWRFPQLQASRGWLDDLVAGFRFLLSSRDASELEVKGV